MLDVLNIRKKNVQDLFEAHGRRSKILTTDRSIVKIETKLLHLKTTSVISK